VVAPFIAIKVIDIAIAAVGLAIERAKALRAQRIDLKRDMKRVDLLRDNTCGG